jgi:DNA topoisomerase-1
LLRASESVLRFPGYRQLYEETREEGEDEQSEVAGLPPLTVDDELRPVDSQPPAPAPVRADQHFTEPPPRFTEATLVKALEENGIGRPSTYAPTLSTIQDRGYVQKDGRALVPQELGSIVNDLLVEHFPLVFNVGFTAEMEEELDEIARGERQWEPVVRQFYDPLEAALESAAAAPRVEEITDVICEKCSRHMVARWGRFGRFLACSGYPECRNAQPLPGEENEPEATDETCEICGKPMMLRSGRYGRFLACSNYPECKGTKRLLKKIGIACPKCAGDIVERQTKRRRRFYGCATYPQCDFTSWSRPLPQGCPQCSGLLVAAGRARKDGSTGARCTKCEWQGAVGEPELAEATA